MTTRLDSRFVNIFLLCYLNSKGRGVKPCVHVHTHKCPHTAYNAATCWSNYCDYTGGYTFHIPSASIGISALCLYPALSCGRPTHLSRSYHAGCKHIQLESSSLLAWVFHANILILVSCSTLGELSWNLWIHSFDMWSVRASKQASMLMRCSHTSVGLTQAHPNTEQFLHY